MKQSKRQKVLERDNYECQECGENIGRSRNPHVEDAEVHHAIPKSNGGSDEMDNLVSLCKECHREKHASSSSSTSRGLLTDSEREVLRGEKDVKNQDAYIYNIRTRFRARMDELEVDLDILEDAGEDELLEAFYSKFGRVAKLEREIEALEQRLDDQKS